MSKSDLPPKGGFSFDLCRRNAELLEKGTRQPPVRQTDNTIAGLVFQDGVILGTGTNCDRNSEQIHNLAPDIYCCGAGIAADVDAVAGTVSSQLTLHCYNTGRESRVVTALTLLTKHLSDYRGELSAAFVLGGVDCSGPHLHTIYPHGSMDTVPFATMGSGSLAAISVFETKYKEGLTRDEGVKIVTEAICSGISNDFNSGGIVDVCVITKGHKEHLRNHLMPNPRTVVSERENENTEVPLEEKVEIIEVGDSMEE